MSSLRAGFGRPLVGGAARGWATWTVVCCAVVVAGLGVLFAHDTTADPFDHAADGPVIALFGGHGDLAVRLSTPGTLGPAAALSGLIVVICLLTRRLNGAVLAATAVPAAEGLVEGVLKPLVHRTYQGLPAYPSGHTTAAFAIAATVAVLLLVPPQAQRFRVVRVLITTIAVLVAGIVAVAVIALRWHYFTDTVAGAAVAIGTVCALSLILDQAANFVTQSAIGLAGP